MLENGIVSGLGNGIMAGISVLFKSIASELNLSRAATSLATGVGSVTNAAVFAFAGWFSDKFGSKWLIIIGTCLFGTGLFLMNFVKSEWTYTVVWGVLVAGGQALAFTVAMDKILTNWFVGKRGLAFGLKFAIFGGVMTMVLPLMSWLAVMFGWRTTCLVFSGIVFISLPITMLVIRDKRPEHYGLLPDGAKVDTGSAANVDGMLAKGVEYAAGFQETEFTFRQILKTPAFWLMTLSWVFFRIIYQGITVHIIPFLTDNGFNPIVAGSLMALSMFFTIPSRFFGGIIADRVKKEHLKFLLAGSFALAGIGILAVLLSQSIATVFVFLIMFGLGTGAFTPLDIVIRGRYFGRKTFGSNQGASVILSVPMSFLAPVFAGWVHDNTGSYTIAYIVFLAAAGLGAILMCFIQLPKPHNLSEVEIH